MTLPPTPAGDKVEARDWSYAFDSDTLRDRFGGSFMASEPDSEGNVSVLLSQTDARAIIAALTAAPAPASERGEAVAVFGGKRLTPQGTKEFWGMLEVDDLPKGTKLYAHPAPDESAALRERVRELRDLLTESQASEAYQRGKAEAAQRVVERLRAELAATKERADISVRQMINQNGRLATLTAHAEGLATALTSIEFQCETAIINLRQMPGDNEPASRAFSNLMAGARAALKAAEDLRR